MYTITITTQWDTKIIVKTHSTVEKDELRALLSQYFFNNYETIEMTIEFSKE